MPYSSGRVVHDADAHIMETATDDARCVERVGLDQTAIKPVGMRRSTTVNPARRRLEANT